MKRYRYLFFLFGVVFSDQAVKLAILSHKSVYLQNTGISFGLLSGNIGSILPVLLNTAILAIASVYWYLKKPRGEPVNYCFSVIIGGGISNIIDRLLHGGVIDYIYLWRFPVFNPADIFIVGGIIILIYILFIKHEQR